MTVSWPSKWVKKYGIIKGEEIDIITKGNSLVLSSDSVNAEKSTNVDVTDLDERLTKCILSILYKKGYDEISVNYNSPVSIKYIKEAVSNVMLGFVIMNQTSNNCLVKSVSRDLSSEFDKTLRRCFLVTLSLAESSFEMIKNCLFSNINDLLSLEQSNNQLTNFCERLINKNELKSEYSSFIYVIIWQLEKIADEYRTIVKIMHNDSVPLNKNLISFYKQVNDFLREFYNIFYKKNLKDINNLYIKGEKLKQSFFNQKIVDKNKIGFYLFKILSSIIEIIPSMIAVDNHEDKFRGD